MRKWIVRIVLGVAAVMMVGAVSSYLFIDRELTRMYGGLTEVADPALSKESMDSYAIFHVNVLAPEGDRFLPDQIVTIGDGEIRSDQERSHASHAPVDREGGWPLCQPGRLWIRGFYQARDYRGPYLPYALCRSVVHGDPLGIGYFAPRGSPRPGARITLLGPIEGVWRLGKPVCRVPFR